jgi:ribosomal protein S18 acetylase RimI-like enzyme
VSQLSWQGGQELAQLTSGTWVVEEASRILGWINAGQSRDPDARPSTGELWAIYVDPQHWRRGMGQLLWQKAEGHLISSGFSEATLWVLKENARAIAFYEAQGFHIELGSEKTITRGETKLLEIRMRRQLGG